MKRASTLNLSLLAVLATLLATDVADAQRNNGRGERGRSEEVRRDRDRDRDWDRDDDDDDDDDGRRRGERRFERRSDRAVPPGWCRGVGNPHRTRANCGYDTDRIYRDRDGRWRDRFGNVIRRDGIYRDRGGVVRDRYGNRIGRGQTRTSAARSSSYDRRHAEFHRQLQASCQARARNASLPERVRIARDCSERHEAWHRREGTRH